MKECVKSDCCPISGLHKKRFPLIVLAGFAFTFVYEFLLHGNILMGMYEQTSHLWRAEEDMKMGLMMLNQFLTTAILAFIFTRNYEGKGLCEGIRFGVMMGLLMGVMSAAAYIWTPIPGALAVGWFLGGLGWGLGLGIIFSLLYKKPSGEMCSTKKCD